MVWETVSFAELSFEIGHDNYAKFAILIEWLLTVFSRKPAILPKAQLSDVAVGEY